MNFPNELKYTSEHEWIRVEGNIGIVGITDFAQNELGDIVYVDIPVLGKTIAQNEVFGSIETVKVVSDLFSPVSGKVIEVNSTINDTPEKVNKDPYNEGWLIKIEISNPEELNNLLTSEAYQKLIK
jgi:glycine cleavage system H protein